MSTPAPPRIHGFAPILPERPRLLILGSMPSIASLRQGQYYGHPRNRFWPLMGELFGAGPECTYPQRTRRLRALGIALWDVLATCERSGSLDAAIVRRSEQANPLADLLRLNPQLKQVCFNGRAAEQAFRRHVRPQLPADALPMLLCLPSTSPANAAWPWPRLLEAWRQILPLD